MKIWIIAPGEEASIWEECKNGQYIAIGWNKININNYRTSQELKKELIDSYADIEENTKKHNFLWKFGKEIKKNDIIVARNGQSRIVGIGIVTGDYIEPDNSNNPRIDKEYAQVRNVKWISTKEFIINNGQFARDTVVKTDINDKRISKYVKDILMLNEMNKKINLLNNRKQIILQGPPGTGKTRVAKQIAIKMIDSTLALETNEDIKNSLAQIEKDRIKLIQFHPSYSYEDFVRGIVATTADDGKSVKYETKDKILAQMAKKALEDKEKNYILIIDEINRANLSSVLGELIYALEYRDEAVESMYALEDGTREITLPSNLYIIGTMNTADRSVGHIDYAIRRRFAFESVLPDKEAINLDDGKKLFEKVEKLFKQNDGKRADTLSIEFSSDDVMLGHSYFIANDKDELEEKLKYQIKPLLEEYVKDGVLTDEAKSKIEEL